MVLDAFSSVVAQADAQGEYLTSAQLDALLPMASAALVPSIQAAKSISDNAQSLTEAAAQAVYNKFPYTTQQAGPNYASTSTGKQKCVRDIDHYLRIISYALVVGGTGPIDDYLVAGLDEINRSFELSPSWYIEALKYIKGNHGLSDYPAVELNSYIDYVLHALS
jgi:phycocyanin alpha chain